MMGDMKRSLLTASLGLSIVEGFIVLLSLFGSPSEQSFFWGYSLSRWVLIFGMACILLLLGFLLGKLLLVSSFSQAILGYLEDYFRKGQRLFWAAFLLLVAMNIALSGWLFSYLFIPVHLRWISLWAAAIALQFFLALVIAYWGRFRDRAFYAHLDVLPKWRNLDAAQKGTFKLLFGVGLLYFLAFTIPNALDARDEQMLYLRGGDENITYPYVVWMLTPAEHFEGTVYRWFVYEDYHYGYPFYVLSMLILLPVRLVVGEEFARLTQLNLLLLRQFISVLPMILSAGIFSYLQTRFRSRWRSLALFAIILLLPGVVQYNQGFWHPDALVILCVALTVFFLDRDRLALRENFLFAAFFCGLASAIKLYGFFFFLSIAGYVLFGLWKRVFAFRRAALVSAGFLVIMFGTLVFSNPFLFVSTARERLVWIWELKAQEIREGYNEPTPGGEYEKGFLATLPAMEDHYGRWFVLAFLLVSSAVAAFYGRASIVNGVILGWVGLTAVYLIWFVAIKNYHYWLPTMIPLFSTFFGLQEPFSRHVSQKGYRWQKLEIVVTIAPWLILGYQVAWSILRSRPFWLEWARVDEIARFLSTFLG